MNESLSSRSSSSSFTTLGSSTSTSKSSKKSKSNNKRKNHNNTKDSKKKKKKQQTQQRAQKRVTFSTVEVLEFSYTIAYQSITEKGPPVGLSFNLARSEILDIDSYEKMQQQTMFIDNKDGELSIGKRFELLMNEGFSRAVIESADKDSKMVRIHRKQSVINMHWDAWDERKEEMRRRVARWANPRYLLYRKGSRMLPKTSNRATLISVH